MDIKNLVKMEKTQITRYWLDTGFYFEEVERMDNGRKCFDYWIGYKNYGIKDYCVGIFDEPYAFTTNEDYFAYMMQFVEDFIEDHPEVPCD